jgi:Ankyrin repeat
MCCFNGYAPLVEELLELDPQSINSLDPNGCTPLMVAVVGAAGKRTKYQPPPLGLVRMLLERGADKTLKNIEGKNAFDLLSDERENQLDFEAAFGTFQLPSSDSNPLADLGALVRLSESKCVRCDCALEKVRADWGRGNKVGFECSKCGTENCWVEDEGSFCGGSCKRFFCYECLPDFKYDTNFEMYCKRTCAPLGPNGTKWDEMSLVSDSDSDSDNEVVQCRGITERGERCKITDQHYFLNAEPLKEGYHYCALHG